MGAASAALADFPTDAVKKCAPDAVVSGTACMDTYEASVWRIPDPLGTNKGLVRAVKRGKATMAKLTAAGATRLGEASDDYAPCEDHGSGCTDVFAVSLLGQTPSSRITWFQAQQACKNSGKRLPLNAEWQAAVAGTPDPGPDDGATDCNTASTFAASPTGSRSSCVSVDGAFDMVGNLFEWVADWVPRSTVLTGSWSGSDDLQGLAGTATEGEPGALLRGGFFEFGAASGPLAVGTREPSFSTANAGFRCAR
ncbi:MAG: SUMF1/EgtB/PvdO family nonheme iron enzyme [Gammaproteobacteria bacterium]